MSGSVSSFGELQIASLRRRTAAGLISTIAAISLFGLAYAAGAWAWREIVSRLPGAEGTLRRASAWFPDWLESVWGERAVAAASVIVTWRVPDWPRGPGARLLRVRRVEIATGKPGSRRTALVQELATIAVRWIINLLLRPVDRGARARQDALGPEIAELRARYPDDQQALNRAMMDLYRRNNLNPLGGCTKKLLAHVILAQLPAILSPRNQNLPARIAGTIMIVEPRTPPPTEDRPRRQ